METPDDKLVAAYVDHGNERAFAQLVQRHQEKVYGYLYAMVHDRDTANDLFQETFVRAIDAMQKRRGGYDHQGRWLQWIMRIARNAALDYLRSRKRWQSADTASDDGIDRVVDRLDDGDPLPDTKLTDIEKSEWLENLISKLPQEQREVLLLRHEAELTFKEIAALTDCSINTALGRMRYALLNLRKMVGTESSMSFTDIDARI